MGDRPILCSAEMVRAILDGRKTQTRRAAPIRELNILQHPGDMITWSVSFLEAVKGALSSHSGGKFSDLQARSIIASQFNPYGKPGDLLWVRETWCAHWGAPPYDAPQSYRIVTGDELPPIEQENGDLYRPVSSDVMTVWYGAEGDKPFHMKWRPSIHMPRWASRITLRITDIRVERLQDISEDDARAEGCEARPFPGPWWQGYRDLGDGELLHQQAVGDTAPDWMIDPKKMPSTPWLDQSARDGFRSIWIGLHGLGAWEANPWVWVVSFERVKP
jgi:hypothetical protein